MSADVGLDHFPKDERWQLRTPALSRAEFLQQPLLRPSFLAAGLGLVSPQRVQVTTQNSLLVQLTNPARRELVAEARPDRSEAEGKTRTDSATGSKLCSIADGSQITCTFAGHAAYTVYVFERPPGSGRNEPYSQVATFKVNNE